MMPTHRTGEYEQGRRGIVTCNKENSAEGKHNHGKQETKKSDF